MEIKEYVKLFNKSFEEVKKEYNEDFNKFYEEEKKSLCNLEDRIFFIENKSDKEKIVEVISLIKSSKKFNEKDEGILSIFINKINSIARVVNRINNFKSRKKLNDGSELKLYQLFNTIKETPVFNELDIELNENLNRYIPHLFSIIKHCQNSELYPIFYPYARNILREVLGESGDYDNMCDLYRKFPSNNRHLNFSTYLGTIGIQIAMNTNNYGFELEINSREYNYLKKHVLTLGKYLTTLDEEIKRDTMDVKEEFGKWLESNLAKKSGGKNSYISALDWLSDRFYENNKIKEKSIFYIKDTKLVDELYNEALAIQKDPESYVYNEKAKSHGESYFYSASLKKYKEFLESIKNKYLLINEIKREEKKININGFAFSCKESGLEYSTPLITRYISSLATKPFVILSGLSGSGKTKLAQSFAQWICADKNQYCIVPVGADWTNREPLLGYVNALNPLEYILPENGALELIINANKEENKHKPYFLILDEMNLSHVERYFADFLSVMESKDEFKLHSSENDLNITNGEAFKNSIQVPNKLAWTDNLFVVGTVNIDETTYMFSPKVLDRANVIEFRINQSEMIPYLSDAKEVNDLEGEGKGMGENFVTISNKANKKRANSETLNKALEHFFIALQKVGAEFGYRTASEIQILFNQIDIINPEYSAKEEEKIDIAIMQKLLPKLHGSRRKLINTLVTLGNLCTRNNEVKKEFFENEKTNIFKGNTNVKYPLSLEKITRMYKSLMENGFASYAEA